MKLRIFDADFALTAIGRKQRKGVKIISCDYCEGTGRDIFLKKESCPFCSGFLSKIVS